MSPRGQEGEALITQLLRASFGLQTALDRCFAHTGLTSQEASVLVHCAEAEELSAGKLAKAMGRDKAKITRFLDRLEANGLVRRVSNSRDHRLLTIKATHRGQRAISELKRTFEQVRQEFLAGIQSEDLSRLSAALSAMHENAGRLYKGKTLSAAGRNTSRE